MISIIKTRVVLYILTIMLAISCVPDDLLIQVSRDKDRAEAIKNGRYWSVPEVKFIVGGAYQDTLLIEMSSNDPNEPIEEVEIITTELITFLNVPFKVGNYNLSPTAFDGKTRKVSVTYTILEKETEKYTYRLDSDQEDNFVSINEVSQDKREISGTFSATFILEEEFSDIAPPEIAKVIEYSSGYYLSKRGI
jgi:hypothetical protein